MWSVEKFYSFHFDEKNGKLISKSRLFKKKDEFRSEKWQEK